MKDVDKFVIGIQIAFSGLLAGLMVFHGVPYQIRLVLILVMVIAIWGRIVFNNNSLSLSRFAMNFLYLVMVGLSIIIIGTRSNNRAESMKEETDPTSVTSDIEEIGWRPMVKGPEEEKMSGVQYVTVSINGLTNDVNGYRHCYINLQAGGCLPDGIPWRRNSQTGLNEVYVVMKAIASNPPGPFFVMRNARVLRTEK